MMIHARPATSYFISFGKKFKLKFAVPPITFPSFPNWQQRNATLSSKKTYIIKPDPHRFYITHSSSQILKPVRRYDPTHLEHYQVQKNFVSYTPRILIS